MIIIIKIVIVIIREIVREAIVEIAVLLTTTQGKRRDSSLTLRQAATPIVIKKTHTENKSNNFKSGLSCWNFRSGYCKKTYSEVQ